MLKYNKLKTRRSFGYSPSDLSPGSHRRVHVFCNCCEKEFLRRYSDLYGKKSYLCRVCKGRELIASLNTSEAVATKRKRTFLKRYRVDNPAKVRRFIEKAEETTLKRYGVRNPMMVEAFRENARRTAISRNKKSKNPYGKTEGEVKSWLKSLGLHFESTLFGGKEIDLYSPTLKFGIEYCGLYWHSEKFRKDRLYHQKKFHLAEKQGFELLTIFEDEWLKTMDRTKMRVLQLLAHHSLREVPQNLTIRKIKKSVAERFLNCHGLDELPEETNLGFYSGRELFAVIPFTSKEGVVTLRGICSVGAFTGLLDKAVGFFQRKVKTTRVRFIGDNRWLPRKELSTWKKIRKYEPRLHIVNTRKLERRKSKNSLSVPPNERLWDCGRSLFERA